jgi:hypothetical protein
MKAVHKRFEQFFDFVLAGLRELMRDPAEPCGYSDEFGDEITHHITNEPGGSK